MKTFRSKIDWWIWVGILVILALIFTPMFVYDDGDWWILLACIVVCLIPPVWMIWRVKYVISGDTLIVYNINNKSRYPISKIKTIIKSRNLLPGPALSHDRINIIFDGSVVVRYGTFRSKSIGVPLVVSPCHQSEFIKDLTSINPSIQLKGF
ncbi:MAG: PH domain-containing protein [Bacteroidales bacterium]|nr:PH domain-containing protein [Bacteroidales bacterium]